MEQIERYSALSMLLTAQLKPGVYTNHFLSPAQCEAEIEQGMWFEPFNGGICLFRRREDHDLMTFYLQRDGELPRLELPKTTVTEVVWRDGKEGSAMRAIAQLEQAGWSVLFHRDRRERPKEEAYAQEQPQMNTEETPDAVLAFLQSSFDPLTGCLPTQAQLASQIALGEVVAQREDGEIVGVLHFEKGRASSEIRHLAVREDRRGKGVASKLFKEYLRRTDGAKSLVWARRGNLPAEHFYESHGYRCDGWHSAVLVTAGKDGNP